MFRFSEPVGSNITFQLTTAMFTTIALSDSGTAQLAGTIVDTSENSLDLVDAPRAYARVAYVITCANVRMSRLNQ